MTFFAVSTSARTIALAATLIATTSLIGTRSALADATLVVEADTGKVLHADHATYPWYPASVTKLMTAYTILRGIKDRRITLDTLMTASQNAVAQSPTKMGFGVGATMTVDNALKMIMVKSANDASVVLAEGLSGSIEKFADEMNAHSKRLGMTQSSWVNPNGLPADEQITSARDMAILARAIITEFPEYEAYWRIPSIRYGKRVMGNHNGLMTSYPGTDGMKTGFICASGFNVVASATRNGRRLIVVVFGSMSSGVRTAKAAQLFEKGFNGTGLSWLMPSLGTVDALQPIAAAPPNLRDEMCGPGRKRPAMEAAEEGEIATTPNPNPSSDVDNSSAYAVTSNSLRDRARVASIIGGTPPPAMAPVVVHLGPAKKGVDETLVARSARPSTRDVQQATGPAAPPRTATASIIPSFGLSPAAAAPAPSTFTPASAESTPVTLDTSPISGPIPIPRPRPKRAGR